MSNPSSSESTSTTNGCPVQHSSLSSPEDSALRPSFFASFFQKATSATATTPTPTATTIPADPLPSSCPMGSPTPPASLEEAARHAQTPQPGQKIRLDTARQVSSIPRGAVDETDHTPHHQHEKDAPKWVYPSEQQLYNAMRRKGWQNVPEDSIPTVLQIHNNINERTWKQIQDWERNDNIHLARFQGRPNDLTPKAWFSTRILQQDAPFDRHDWYVQNGPTITRYVIDYYYLQAPEATNLPPIPYVDARPALETPRSLYLHANRFVRYAFPGITKYVQRQLE